MKKIVLSLLMMLFFANSYSQSILWRTRTTEYIYGKMINATDTLVGYFSFDKEITQNGQTVYYKESLDSNKKKRFQSRKYDYFESDSLYMEKVGAVPILTGDVLIMIPRIINGRIQLFDSRFRWGPMELVKSEHFFIKKETQKMRIKKNKFKEQMKNLIGDDAALIDRIDRGELTYDNLEEIILTYNRNNPV